MKLPLAAAALALALSVGGCATNPFSRALSTYEAITDASIPPQVVTVAGNSFDALVLTAKNYLIYCSPAPSPPGCDDTTIQRKLIPAIRSGQFARNSLESFQASHPGQLGSKGLYEALTSASATIQSIVGQWQQN